MNPGFIAAGLLAAGLFFLGLAIARLGQRRPMAALRSGCAGCFSLALGALLVAIGLNLYTYARLSYEQPVAELAFKQTGPQQFRARLVHSNGQARAYALNGDQWQLDARVLKWHGMANLLGLDAQYRLERLSGRYTDTTQENTKPGSTHELGLRGGLDVWRVAHRYENWLPLVDARYGSATYLPMADGARYSVSLTQSGLVARPVNPAAAQAIRRW